MPPPGLLDGYRAAFIDQNSKLPGPRFKFAKHGASGAEVSKLSPKPTEVVDDAAIVIPIVVHAFNRAPGQIPMSTGPSQFGRPGMGSQATYGPGSESRDLPGFIVFSTGKKGPNDGNPNWSSGLLPTVHQGVPFRSCGYPMLYLSNLHGVDQVLQADSLRPLGALNRMRLDETGDPETRTRINSFEMAFRMQSVAPEVMGISGEPKHVPEPYGVEPDKSSLPMPACRPVDWPSAGYGLSRSSMKPGTSTATWSTT